MLADVHKNFRDKCIEIYELEIAYFLSGSARIIMASSFKKKVNLELLTNIVMLLIVEKGIAGGVCQSIYQYTEANIKYINDYDLIKNRHTLCIGI